MQKRRVRVLVASGSQQAQSCLREIVDTEKDAVIVGQADNAIRALTSTRNLRPDVVLIDSHLPYLVGLDNIPSSRVSGLDTAQVIFQEIPNTQVIIVANTDLALGRFDCSVNLSISEEAGKVIHLKLCDLGFDGQRGTLIFANVQVKPVHLDKGTGDAFLVMGGFSLFFGFVLIASMVLLIPGVVMMVAGLASIYAGGVMKILSKWRSRMKKGD